MSDTNKLDAEIRTEFGKGASRRTRRAGKVPAVLYGHGEEPQHLAIPTLEFAAILRHSGTNSILDLQIDGEQQFALTKQVDVNPLTREIEHTDLLIVRKGEKVVVEVNVHVEGDAAPGTLVTQDATYVEVEADALNIPEEFVVSVEGVEAGTQILASDVTLPAGVELTSDPEMLIVNVIEAPTEADLEAEEDSTDAEEAPEEPAAEDESES